MEVILYINSYIINAPSESRPLEGFYSAFAFESISGYLFIETSQPSNLNKFIAQTQIPSAFFRNQNIHILSSLNHIMLFQEAICYNSPPSWIRFSKGLYKGDIACVRSHSDKEDILEVYVVPRWNPFKRLFPITGSIKTWPPHLLYPNITSLESELKGIVDDFNTIRDKYRWHGIHVPSTSDSQGELFRMRV